VEFNKNRMTIQTRLKLLQFALTVEQRRGLAETIDKLQKRFFGRSTDTDIAPSLEQIARQWLAFARSG
jgi:hypothetical protein